MITWAERAKAATSQTGQGGTAKTDETAISRLLAVSAVPTVAASAMPERLSSVLAVPSPAVLEKHDFSIVATEDPDRWCWPHSSAMNGAEIDTFAVRLPKFTDKGLARTDGEALADKLVVRDRDLDDRRLCMECASLARRVCRAAGTARLPGTSRGMEPVRFILQRCDAYIDKYAHAREPANSTPMQEQA